jgi:hypothetical protein
VKIITSVVGGPVVINIRFAEFDHHDDVHDITFASWTPSAVPEPPIALLMASGLIIFGVARRQVKLNAVIISA